ncbi:MAG: hypothetical protein AB4041_12155 [Microcystaceae cyanobacterium]
MAKKRKSSQFPKGNKNKSSDQNSSPAIAPKPPSQPSNSPAPSLPVTSQSVQPEQISLLAHRNIQTYLTKYSKANLSKEDVNAVLRLSQHLRVFGLLSAVGYVNQSNEQTGEVRQRTVPVWECLLGNLIDAENSPNKRDLMTKVQEMAEDEPQKYRFTWRKALNLSKYWNFWAKAYEE